jgi:Mn-dependent DtxR family transcriptional regulator
MGKSKIFNVLFREKPAMMLVEMRNSKNEIYASNLAKAIDCTYSHVVKILQEMQRDGLVEFDKQGRLKLLKLTKKGEEVAESITKIKFRLEN